MSYISLYYVYKNHKKYRYYRLSAHHKFIKHLGKVHPGSFPKQNIQAVVTLKNLATKMMSSNYHFGEEKRLVAELQHRDELAAKLKEPEFKSYHSFNPVKIDDAEFRKMFLSNKKHLDEIESDNDKRISEIKKRLKNIGVEKDEMSEIKKLQQKAIDQGSWKVRSYADHVQDCPSVFVKNVQMHYHRTPIQKEIVFKKDSKTGFRVVTAQDGVLHIPSYNSRELKDMQYVDTKKGYKAFHLKQRDALYANLGKEAYDKLLSEDAKKHYAKTFGYKYSDRTINEFTKDFKQYMLGELKDSNNKKDKIKQKFFERVNTKSWRDEDYEMKQTWRTQIHDPEVSFTRAERHRLGEINKIKPESSDVEGLNAAIMGFSEKGTEKQGAKKYKIVKKGGKK